MAKAVDNSHAARVGALALFAGCSRSQCRAIDRLGTELAVGGGRIVAGEGERGRELMVVLAGSAVCMVGDQLIGRLVPGDFFGELGLLEGSRRSTTVVTAESTTLLVFNRREFHEILRIAPSVRQRIVFGVAAPAGPPVPAAPPVTTAPPVTNRTAEATWLSTPSRP